MTPTLAADLHVPPPLMAPETWPAEYRDGLGEHRLLVPSCGDCGARFFPPAPVCRHCTSDAIVPADAGTHGTIYSFTIVQHSLPTLKEAVPFAIAVISLLDAAPVRLVGHLEPGEGRLEIGTSTRASWDGLPAGALPRWRLVD